MGNSNNGIVYITSTVDGVHTRESHHYVGRAADLGVNDNLQQWLYLNKTDLQINDLFGPVNMINYQLDKGKPYFKFVKGHENHIHVSIY